ncbi:hypothetical protein EH183_42015 [Streptomyces sp. CB01881]|uniref:hypothetical protein n=1 Tax=Streptomyces sp. CB01881 TaxID=2078691 RepID=UPI0011E00BE3|nr:hypothetical protein [Streptomyces sp. CB01881]TYC66569.1 hypothetical protein EH183_42015 [Streptomyces sp. CB01881]
MSAKNRGVMVKKIAVAVIVAALGAIAAPASAAGASSTTYDRECPAEVYRGGDDLCWMTHTASKWYNGDWVALHIKTDGQIWVNGYTPNNVDYRVWVTNGSSHVFSVWKRGGTGVGASAGDYISTSGDDWGVLEYANHHQISVYIGR